MKIPLIPLALVFTLFSAACAIAPLSTNTTARSLGAGGVELQAGMIGGTNADNGIPQFKFGVGLSENLDLGFQYELLSLGFLAKYAFLNAKDHGLALAGLGGTGISGNGTYWYLGPIISYKAKMIEPYFQTRFNYVNFNETEGSIDLGVFGKSDFTIPGGSYQYLTLTAGLGFWPLHWFGITLEATRFAPFSSEDSILIGGDSSQLMYAGAVAFRF